MLQRLSSPHCVFSAPWLQIVRPHGWADSWTLLFVHWSAFMPGPCSLGHCSLWYALRSGSVGSPALLSFLMKNDLAIQSPLGFHLNFKMAFSISAKIPPGFLMGVPWLCNHLGQCGYPINITYSPPWTLVSSQLFVSSLVSFSNVIPFQCKTFLPPWINLFLSILFFMKLL